MSATDLIDLREFAATLRGRRNKAAMVLHPQIEAQRAYALRVAEELGWAHLDMLMIFADNAQLAERLAEFSQADFFDHLRKEGDDRGVVVSGIEFLLAAWMSQGKPREVKCEFCSRLELWERSPAFLLIIHEDPVLANYQPTRHPGSRLILKTSETLALT